MKKWICAALAMVMLLGCAGAVAQEYVSIQEVYDQAQAIGGWWKETFETPNGEVTIDAPIIVPDVEKMPVITVEKAKISEELFNQIAQGKHIDENADAHRYEVELDGRHAEVYLGMDNKQYAPKQRTGKYGYDAVDTLHLYRGEYGINSQMGTAELRAYPTTFHYPWELDEDMPCVRNSDVTLNEALEQWNEEIALCFPDEDFTIRPTKLMLRGSMLTNETGSGKQYKRNGYLVVSAGEQLIDGVPMMGSIHSKTVWSATGGNEPRSLEKYKFGCDAASSGFYGNFTDTQNYRLSMEFVKTRSVEYADVPLAPLDDVLDNIQEKIEKGYIREIDYIKLGYIQYSNPDMTDYAWAIPCWEIGAEYVMKSSEKMYKRWKDDPRDLDGGPWLRTCFAEIPIDAQNGEAIIFSTGSKEVYSVPDMVTWEEVK